MACPAQKRVRLSRNRSISRLGSVGAAVCPVSSRRGGGLQQFLHALAHLAHQRIDAALGERGGVDRRADMHFHRRADVQLQAPGRQQLLDAADRHRHDDRVGLLGQAEAALLERLQLAIPRARALGRRPQHDAAFHHLARLGQVGHGLVAVVPVDGGKLRRAHRRAPHRHGEQLALGQHADRTGQGHEDRRDVVEARMGAQDHVAAAIAEVGHLAMTTQARAGQAQQAAGPVAGKAIDLAAAQSADSAQREDPHAVAQGDQNGRQAHQGDAQRAGLARHRLLVVHVRQLPTNFSSYKPYDAPKPCHDTGTRP